MVPMTKEDDAWTNIFTTVNFITTFLVSTFANKGWINTIHHSCTFNPKFISALSWLSIIPVRGLLQQYQLYHCKFLQNICYNNNYIIKSLRHLSTYDIINVNVPEVTRKELLTCIRDTICREHLDFFYILSYLNYFGRFF